MKFTERDKKLAVVVPAAIVLLAYGFFFLRPKTAEKARVERQLADAAAKAPSHAHIGMQSRELARERKQVQDLETKLAAVQTKWRYETAFCTHGPDRHDRIEKLTGLLGKYYISAIEDTDVESGGKDAKLSPAQESVLKKIAQMSAAQKPQLRRIRFYGRFAEVHQILDSLAAGEVVAIPVGLTMKTIDDPDNRREWTLLVWL